jgi:hypothetical protein
MPSAAEFTIGSPANGLVLAGMVAIVSVVSLVVVGISFCVNL